MLHSIPSHLGFALRASRFALRASRYALRSILPELIADVFKHHNRIPRTRGDILRNDAFIDPHRLRKPYTYHTIRVVWVNLPKRTICDRLVLRVMLVVKEELQHFP